MGSELYERLPAFREAFDAVCAELDEQLERPLREVMFAAAETAEAKLLDETGFTQPALFALEVALYRVLEQWGVKPDFLLGHSIGELAAAHVAGVWSLGDACTLVAARGRLMQALPRGGAMVALEASEAETRRWLRAGVEMASVNGPTATVIAGDEAAVLAVAEAVRATGRKATRLRVSHAFHSAHMDGMLEELGRVAAGLRYAEPKVAIVSNLTGRRATAEELTRPEYWVRQARQEVRFADGMRALEADGVTSCVELGPQGVLAAMGAGCLSDASKMQVVAAQRRGRDGAEALLAALGRAARSWCWRWTGRRLLGRAGRRGCVGLPTYAFQRQRYWLEAEKASGDAATMGLSSAEHPLLGAATPLADSDGFLLTGRLSGSEPGWLGDHAVFGTVLLPGTGLLELGFAAARAVGSTTVSQLTLVAPLVVPARRGGSGPGSGGWRRRRARKTVRGVSIFGRSEEAAEGRVDAACARRAGRAEVQPREEAGLEVWPPVGGTPIDLTGHYATLQAARIGLRSDVPGTA